MESETHHRSSTPRSLLVAALEMRVSEGYTIEQSVIRRAGLVVDGGFVNAYPGRGLSVLGALLLGRMTAAKHVWDAWPMMTEAAAILGVDEHWIGCLVAGFDDTEEPIGIHDDAWELGAELRDRFVKQVHGVN